MIHKVITALFIGALFWISVPVSVSAATGVDPFKDVCKGNSSATVCKEKTSAKGKNPVFGPEGIITRIINLLSIIVGIVAVVGIMMAGLKYITSGSNPQEVTIAREIILYAVVALVITAMAQVIVRFIIGKVNV